MRSCPSRSIGSASGISTRCGKYRLKRLPAHGTEDARGVGRFVTARQMRRPSTRNSVARLQLGARASGPARQGMVQARDRAEARRLYALVNRGCHGLIARRMLAHPGRYEGAASAVTELRSHVVPGCASASGRRRRCVLADDASSVQGLHRMSKPYRTPRIMGSSRTRFHNHYQSIPNRRRRGTSCRRGRHLP